MSFITISWYENPNNEEGGEKKKKLHPRIVLNGNLTTEEMIRNVSESSTLTPGDVKASLMELSKLLAQGLCSGKRVHVDGFGYFTPVVEATDVVTAETKRRGGKVKLKGINFVPDKELKSQFATIHFHESNVAVHSNKISEEEIDRRLTAYFAEHPFLTRAEFQTLCGLTRTTAIVQLRRLREEGKLDNVGRSNSPVYVWRD
jgi:predicted histone-like DNA-binding protein